MSKKLAAAKLTVAESFDRSKNVAGEIKECCSKKKTAPSEIPIEKPKEIAIKATKIQEAQKTKSTKDDKAEKAIPTRASKESLVKDIKQAPEVTKVHETLKKESPKESLKDIKNIKSETLTEIRETKMSETLKTKSTKDDKAEKAILTRAPEESPVKDIKLAEVFEVTKVLETLKKETPKDVKDFKLETSTAITKVSEILETESTKDDQDEEDEKAIPARAPEESPVKDIKLAETPEVIKVHETLKKEFFKDIKDFKLEVPAEIGEITKISETLKTESTKDKDEKAIPARAPEESPVKDIKLAEAPEVTKVYETLKKEFFKDVKDFKLETSTAITKVSEFLKTESTKDNQDEKDEKAIPARAPEESPVKDIKLAEAPEVTKVHETLKKEFPKDVKDFKLEIPAEIGGITKISEILKTESTKDDQDEKDEAIPAKAFEESPVKDIKLADAPEVTKVHETLKKESPKDIKDIKLESPAEIHEIKIETLKTESTKDVKDDKSRIPTKDFEESSVKNTEPFEAVEVIKVHDTKKESPEVIKDDKLKSFIEAFEITDTMEALKAESTEAIKDDSSEIVFQDPEESNDEDIKFYQGDRPLQDEDVEETKKIPVLRKDLLNPWDIGARKIWRPLSAPNMNERPLVLAIHLSPSLPIEVFEVFAEIIEVVTKKPVVLLYETRFGRPVAKDITDIAILPAANNWDDGVLLPASFVFEHHLNKNNSPHVYADVIVADDRAPHVDTIMDLRGHRCAIPNRCDKICVTSLLFNYLQSKGENPAFFGNILDANSQLEVLRMVAGKQAEVGILEAPVIGCHKMTIIGAEFLQILLSLGPLPPYRIMINKALENTLAKELTTYLLNINQRKEWMDRLSPFGIVGFAENSTDFYNLDEIKSVITSVRYY
ncbi:WEB family protein At4g27595, chloroplastic [Camponotus floridanus]|uniref:WEB family protein At4g27595, chloroplastic n=1 Tax=Camponotus floridanus TaxID=104421 RepID=UPI000DC68725|nr:WEB family protein At4g27595, chloroplastic [Camponotus floridanus]